MAKPMPPSPAGDAPAQPTPPGSATPPPRPAAPPRAAPTTSHGLTLERSARHLLKILLDDQRQRWQRGERPRVEDYLNKFPLLRDAPDLFELIYEEFLLREQLGEQPAVEEYAGRFPGHAEQLRK